MKPQTFVQMYYEPITPGPAGQPRWPRLFERDAPHFMDYDRRTSRDVRGGRLTQYWRRVR